MSKKEELIKDFLKSQGFTRNQKGFIYMSEAIALCIDNQLISGKELNHTLGEKYLLSDSQVLSALNYSLKYAKANGLENVSLLSFIRESADQIKKDLQEEEK